MNYTTDACECNELLYQHKVTYSTYVPYLYRDKTKDRDRFRGKIEKFRPKYTKTYIIKCNPPPF